MKELLQVLEVYKRWYRAECVVKGHTSPRALKLYEAIKRVENSIKRYRIRTMVR